MSKKRHLSEDEHIAERRALAFSLRKAGATYRQIATHIGCSTATVYDDIAAELEDLRKHTIADVAAIRTLELERCDAVIAALWTKRADHKVATALMRVFERRAKLLGVDMPTKIEGTGGVVVPILYLPDNGRDTPDDEGGDGGGSGSLPQA